jgi:hypothetical protein
MPTGDEFVNAVMKRFLSQNRIADNIIEYLQENSFDVCARAFPQQGMFTYPVTITPGSGDFALSVAPAGSIESTDGLGHVMKLITARQTAISYEAAISSTYWIGKKFIEIPNGMYDNPRTGIPEYDKIMEEVGELENPTSVTDDGGGVITLNVNSIFESGVDHTGRIVRVWLVNPLSGDQTVAFEDCVVSYAATDNSVSTTSSSLGQGTISTNAPDYQVACLGVSVRKSVSNPFGDEYSIVGKIVLDGGGSPTATDQAEQSDFSGGENTLQSAYDGAGSGGGRAITVNDLAVLLSQSNSSFHEKDIAHAVLRMNKNDDETDPVYPWTDVPRETEMGIDAKMRFNTLGSLVHRTHIWDYGGNDEVLASETVQVTGDGNTLTFTRSSPPGLDLDLATGDGTIYPDVDFVEISEAENAVNNGLFIIKTLIGDPTNTVTLYELDALTDAALVTETGTGMVARFYRPTTRIGGMNGGCLARASLQDFQEDVGGNFPVDNIWVPVNTLATKKIINITYSDNTNLFKLLADGSIVVAEQTFQKTIHPYSSHHAGNWVSTGLDAISGTPSVNLTTTAGVEGLTFPLKMPEGVELVSVEVLVNPGGVAQDIELRKWTPVWSGTPGEGSVSFLDTGTKATTTGSADEVVTLVPDSTEMVDGASHYDLFFAGDNVSGTTNMYGLRLTIKVTTLTN